MNDREPDMVNGMPVHLIVDVPALERAAAAWMHCEVLAVDTEFMRVRTFYPLAALYQICDGTACFLIDPVRCDDLSALAAVLAAPGVLKIMHSISEDLEVCERHLGVLPEPLIDTQVAAAFCGYGLSVGYQKIIASELDVHLEKSETRTDWLQRPLTAAQLHYAAADVAYLPQLWQSLQRRLAPLPGASLVRLECDSILARFRGRIGMGDYRAIAGAWRLDRRALAVLRALYMWREETARSRDLPRSWLVPDVVLLRIAERMPLRAEDLAGIDELPDGSRRRHAAAIIEQVRAAQESAPDSWPQAIPAPLDSAQSKRVKRLRERVSERAAELEIAPEMLARRRELEELLRWTDGQGDTGAELPVLLQGWRHAAIGAELARVARGEPA
jgi:ribonuclease D